MWLIASIPFWLAGLIFLRGAVLLLLWPGANVVNDRQSALLGLLIAGITFLIAAKVAS